MNNHDTGNLSYDRECKLSAIEDKIDWFVEVFEYLLNILTIVLLILVIGYGAYLSITRPVTEIYGLPQVECGKVGPLTIYC
jgi:hypothetical protein